MVMRDQALRSAAHIGTISRLQNCQIHQDGHGDVPFSRPYPQNSLNTFTSDLHVEPARAALPRPAWLATLELVTQESCRDAPTSHNGEPLSAWITTNSKMLQPLQKQLREKL